MSLRRIEKYVEILLHLYSIKTATINQIVQEFKMRYSTLSSLFKKWTDEQYISKVERDITYAGEDRYSYQITQKGISYLKDLEEKLDKTLKNSS